MKDWLMSIHSAEIVGLRQTVSAPSYRDRDEHHFTVQAGIVVKPPIVVGEGLKRAVLGVHTDRKDIGGGNIYLDMTHILNTSDESIFVAGATTPFAEASIENIQKIADRIIEVAADPARAIDMQYEDTFNSPYSSAYPELKAITEASLAANEAQMVPFSPTPQGYAR